MKMKLNIAIMVLLVTAASVVEARSQRCKSSKPATTPTSDFKINGNGTVTHLKTGLIWKQCSEGQSGKKCDGDTTIFYWQDAMDKTQGKTFAGSNKWRVPTIDELKSIVEKQCKGPSYNLEVFPNSPLSMMWSSTEIPNKDNKVWQMYSPSGVPLKASKASEGRVRLVRDPS